MFVLRPSIYYFGTKTIDKDQNIRLFLNKCIVCLELSFARWPLTSHSLRRAPSTVGDSLLPLSPNLLPMYLPTFKISPNLLHVYSLNMDWPPGKSFVHGHILPHNSITYDDWLKTEIWADVRMLVVKRFVKQHRIVAPQTNPPTLLNT